MEVLVWYDVINVMFLAKSATSNWPTFVSENCHLIVVVVVVLLLFTEDILTERKRWDTQARETGVISIIGCYCIGGYLCTHTGPILASLSHICIYSYTVYLLCLYRGTSCLLQPLIWQGISAGASHMVTNFIKSWTTNSAFLQNKHINICASGHTSLVHQNLVFWVMCDIKAKPRDAFAIEQTKVNIWHHIISRKNTLKRT